MQEWNHSRLSRLKSGAPVLPAEMQEQTPMTSRFLDALEARHERTQRQLTDAISFASYRKEANE